EWNVSRFVVSNNSKYIFLNAHYKGNEKMQIFILPISGGEPKRITKDLNKRYLLSDNCQLDDTHLIISSNQLGSTHDVAILNIENGGVKFLTATDSNLEVEALSPNGDYLVISEFVSHSKSNLYLMSMEDYQIELITPSQNDGHYFFACWTSDSNGFYVNSNTSREFFATYYFDIESKSFEQKIAPNWDVSKVCVAPNGKWLAWTVNENGYDVLYLKGLNDSVSNSKILKSGGKIDIHEFSANSNYLAFSYGDCTKVSDIHILDLTTNEEFKITNNMLGGIESQDMVVAELVKIKGTTGLDFTGFLYKPIINYKQRVPAILFIHGGPDLQERPYYDSLKQCLLSLGIGILAPNIRGSTGYGQSFQKLIHRKFGDIKGDIEGCVNYLRSLDWIDPNQIGIMGGSFGGYATLLAITKLAHLNWKVAVEISGPSNLITFTTNIPDYWRPLMKAWVGDPIEDKEMLESISPVNFVEQIKCENILIGQGGNDPRVPKNESDQIVEKLRKMGKKVDYLEYLEEGHDLEKKSNYLDFNRKAIEFIYKSFYNVEINFKDEIF
ncbi:MAG: S9 family peptidase, partial [Asgard group archaeon]|nr:S9 family peptidase [Asgard group archaeon]